MIKETPVRSVPTHCSGQQFSLDPRVQPPPPTSPSHPVTLRESCPQFVGIPQGNIKKKFFHNIVFKSLRSAQAQLEQTLLGWGAARPDSKPSSLQGVLDKSDLPKTTRLYTWKEEKRATVRPYTVNRKIICIILCNSSILGVRIKERQTKHEIFVLPHHLNCSQACILCSLFFILLHLFLFGVLG